VVVVEAAVSCISLNLYFVNKTFRHNFKWNAHNFRTRFRHVSLSAILFIDVFVFVLVR